MAQPIPTTAPALLRSDDPGFELARRGLSWNARTPSRRPDAIARAASADDVVTAVRYARERGLRVALRSGGHSWWGAPLRDGGLALDLCALRDIEIDALSRTAWVGPGVRARDLARALAPHRLAFQVGHCASVAVGGYLLAGGFGWNAGEWGPACLSVRAIEVVTGAGEHIVADETRSVELLWAARGAGPGSSAP